MFPISDDNTDRHLTPYVNYVFIAVNIFVFFVLQGMGGNYGFTYAFSTVPAEIISGQDVITQPSTVYVQGQAYEMPGLQMTPIPVYLTMLTSMFMHGGFGHIFGNMLFLWIFGDNIENRLGHSRYFAFYLICGVIASLAHVYTSYFFNMDLNTPSLGASGAISGIMGAYLVLFPKRRVNVLLLRFIVAVPAIVTLGLWIVLQIISGMGMLGGKSDGVAYAAHIGGFLGGMLLVKFFDKGQGYVDGELAKRKRFM